ncbi:hypothetical protein [Mucilaginibacter aquaedulcis]|uniref:hypothetical protein n=1 Tax=Mucilaginibacter aquaedulcis TaxID=1187081 RepID=UPI0025B39529|nr:hypothetical protein [Mucilaginibacter aquaedulcis]MDN3548355.1 hypothetical protein [Mucilaginibacter aquaedulcis]
MISESINANLQLNCRLNLTALYGTFNNDMSSCSTVDITTDIIEMVENDTIVIPKSYDFNKRYPLKGSRKFLQIAHKNRIYNITEDKYSDNIVIDLSSSESEISIIYNVFIDPLANWRGIIAGQLLQLKSFGIVSEADVFVHITDSHKLSDEAVKLIKSIIPTATISISTENKFEYGGIKLVHSLAKLRPDRKYIYFHSKGMSHGLFSRSLVDITLMTTTFSKWRKHIQHLGKNGVEKIGMFPGFGDENPSGNLGKEGGFIWFNFWYATGKYLSNCPEPHHNQDRYYYEKWLGFQNGDTIPTLREDCRSIYKVKMMPTTFYSSQQANHYMDRLIYKYNHSSLSKALPYIIRSSLIFHLYLKMKNLPRNLHFRKRKKIIG